MSSAPAGQRFPKSVRLLKSPDFRRVQRRGRRVRGGRHLVVLHLTNDLEGPRIGLAVSRKVGNAVVRNRVKRWLREAVRRQLAGLPPVDVVCIARPSAAGAGLEALFTEIDQAFAAIRSVAHPPRSV